MYSATHHLRRVTHTVLNQSSPYEGYNAYLVNVRAREAVEAFGGQWAADHLAAHGARVGSAAALSLAHVANENPPVFKPFDRNGNRINAVEYHPAYHDLMRLALEGKAASFAWEHHGKPGAHVARAALMYMQYQLESGTCCPTTMTFAAVPALRTESTASDYREVLTKLMGPGGYDASDVPMAHKKHLTIGMSMTEKQGGSDVRANTTQAKHLHDSTYSLVGHKWFTSAPMSDGFLTLAQTEGKGLSCFLVPRWLPDGSRNVGLQFQRLKGKVGDRSNASSEVEYHDAIGTLVGKVGEGVKTIAQMVNHTRLECALGSAALATHAVRLAAHHTSQRCAFGGKLLDKPLMRGVMVHLALEAEALTALALRTAAAYDDHTASGLALQRIQTAIAKFYVCKRAPAIVLEALECMGGNGYVEEFPIARMYRQAPLNSIWEGSGNVMALDVLRALKDAKCAVAVQEEIEGAVRAYPKMSPLAHNVLSWLRSGTPGELEPMARKVAECSAILLQASALYRFGPREIADAYVELVHATASSPLQIYGTIDLPSTSLCDVVVGRLL